MTFIVAQFVALPTAQSTAVVDPGENAATVIVGEPYVKFIFATWLLELLNTVM